MKRSVKAVRDQAKIFNDLNTMSMKRISIDHATPMSLKIMMIPTHFPMNFEVPIC